jgi:geranylgeranyl diphosphate synthase type II
LGEKIGEAYQVADDLLDAMGAGDAGKPVGRDVALGRPSSVAAHGVEGALSRLKTLVSEAADAVPECDGADSLRALVCAQAKRLVPKNLAVTAA